MSTLRPRPLHLAALALIFGAVLILAPAASAQDFETRLDCGGDFAPGSIIPIEISVENMTDEDIPVDALISIDVPGIGVIDLRAAPFTLTAGQDYVNTEQTIRLPQSAPVAQNYMVLITVNSANLMTFDSCDFDVE